MHGEWFKGAIEAAEAQTLVNQLQRTSRGWVPRTIPAARKDVDSSVPKYLDRTYRHIGTICKFCHDIPDVNVSCPSSDDGSHRRQIAVELIDPDRALPLPRGRFAVTDPALLQKIKQAYGK
jgi:hypothetical protein